MKDGMRQYAFKSRKIQESYLRKHSDGGAGRKAREAGRCHRIQQSRESKKEEVNAAVELYGKFVQLTEQVIPNVPLSEEEQLALDIYTKALKESSTKLRQLDEERREKENIEAYQGRQQGIQETISGRQEISKNIEERKIVMKKMSKHEKHESKESKKTEAKEDKKEKKSKSKQK